MLCGETLDGEAGDADNYTADVEVYANGVDPQGTAYGTHDDLPLVRETRNFTQQDVLGHAVGNLITPFPDYFIPPSNWLD